MRWAPGAGEVLCFTRWIAQSTHGMGLGYITSLRSLMTRRAIYIYGLRPAFWHVALERLRGALRMYVS